MEDHPIGKISNVHLFLLINFNQLDIGSNDNHQNGFTIRPKSQLVQYFADKIKQNLSPWEKWSDEVLMNYLNDDTDWDCADVI